MMMRWLYNREGFATTFTGRPSFFYQFFQIYLENILIDYGNIGILGKGIPWMGIVGLYLIPTATTSWPVPPDTGSWFRYWPYFQHTVIRLYVPRPRLFPAPGVLLRKF